MAIKLVEMQKKSDHKKTVKYETSDINAAVGNAYVSRTAFATMPDKIYVAVSDKPINSGGEGKKAG
jgi:hypothetical protein